MRVFLEYKTRKFWLEVKSCNWFKRFFGLMFVRRGKAEALLFDFKKPVKIAIHSYFVFFPFVAIWLNNKNKILDLKIIKPFRLRVCPRKSFAKLIEIPVNKKYERVIKFFAPNCPRY